MPPAPRVTIRDATEADLPLVQEFLRNNNLPIIGVEKCLANFVVAQSENGTWVGVAGVEIYGKSGLLRSVAVSERFRGLGYGKALVDAVLSKARTKKVETIYLFTENAEKYFRRFGFETVERASIDASVQTSPEFTECCESAVAMRIRETT